jgi:subtilase family serine protease
MKKARTSLSVAAVAGALVVSATMASATATAAPSRRVVPHTAPTWVARAHSLGAAPADGSSTFKIYLTPHGGIDALEAAVARVSDPRSAAYQRYLSAAAYHRRYDPSSSTVHAVSGWLASNHLSVTAVEAHHRYLEVRGTNAAVQKAFAVKVNRYRHHGRTVQANSGAVSVPSSIGSYVTTVSGLDTTPHFVKHAISPPPAGFRNAPPCSAYYGQKRAATTPDGTPLPRFKGEVLPYVPCGYTGRQFRSAYENNSALSGKGVTVAIIDAYASPTIAADASTYARRHGDHPYAPRQLTQHNAPAFTFQEDCGENGWWGEETLDVEAVHAMARDARIRYYGGESCQDADLLTTQTQVVDENKASIITNSYGDLGEDVPRDLVLASRAVFLQAALQGISFLFSSGDNGDEVAATGTRQPDYSASDPFVTAVGGTADAIDANGRFLFQTGWGTHTFSLSASGTAWEPGGFLYGAGGGTSALFAKPWYQRGVVPARYGTGRAVPDIAMDADPQTGMLIGQTQAFPEGVHYGEYRIGGTSLASPLFAGMSALRQQKAGHRLGFQNPVIYDRAGSGVLTDVKGEPRDRGVVRVNYNNSVDESDGVSYLVRTFDQDSSLETVRGWDDVTGVGAPRAGWLDVAR